MNISKMSAKAKRNLLANQADYMRQTGRFIRLDHLAAKLLETATLPPQNPAI